jgi:hypothetical protein
MKKNRCLMSVPYLPTNILRLFNADKSHYRHIEYTETRQNVGTRGSSVIKALCNKSGGRGFQNQSELILFTFPNPSGRTQPLREMSNRSRKNPVRKADNLVATCEPIV